MNLLSGFKAKKLLASSAATSVLFVLACACPALAIELTLWNPGPGYPPMILPVPKGSTPREAAARYLKAINSDPRIVELRDRGLLKIPPGRFSPFPADGKEVTRPLFGVTVNELTNMDYRHRDGVRNLLDNLKRQGAEPYVIPVMADIDLSIDDAKDFRKTLSRSLDALLVKGGPDIDPQFYGQDLHGAHDPIPARDRSELKLVTAFAQEEHGVLYGICRGHQLCAVAHGHELIQDIETETTAPSHSSGWHKIRVSKDSLLYQLMGREEIDVNTFHHESVIPKEGTGLRITAHSEDSGKIVEATEFRNALGFTFQFHPELMDDDTGKKIMHAMVIHAEMARKHRISEGCMKGFSGLLKNIP